MEEVQKNVCIMLYVIYITSAISFQTNITNDFYKYYLTFIYYSYANIFYNILIKNEIKII